MKNADVLLILKAELKADIEQLEELYQKYDLIHHKLAQIRPDEFDYIALAYTMANLYSMIETYFMRIAKAFENNLEPTYWHRQLLERMCLEIEGLRPAFMTRQDYVLFDELRAFRHVFRHLYQNMLDIDKLRQLDQKVPETIKRFRELHPLYLNKLEAIIDQMEK